MESFIRYHLALGIAHIYILFDDPEDPAIQVALKFPDVTAIPNDEALQVQQALGNVLYPKYGPHVGYEVMARQILNVETAYNLPWIRAWNGFFVLTEMSFFILAR